MTEEIKTASEAIKNGEVILYPTDTVWGMGCDVRNQQAVNKILSIKKRPASQPLVVMIAEIGQLYDYVQKVPDIAWDIVEYAEKPLTVIYPKGKNVAPNLLASDGSIAVQLNRDEFCQKLIQKCGRAITFTSACQHLQPKPATLPDVEIDIVNAVDHVVNLPVVDKTKNTVRLSTIIRLELNGQIAFLRK
ncbi:Sua5/YciO/YrdC/YwlC family protein [Rhodocytophaga rosea]|uniref:L-threonylcarbamoyladenylate synthase n=1 Tax=Rhodocytophaga rosea TaxID=2704465 RepID=A0A6C0GKU7_9BACT|nr:Sua5/YciO/YrdC/YwlC family protein [Rhodocytophaga rosea]QHT68638.1 Sua5/YciO/YrdC/YwlC family protein [Rhodocytophaga rosea]